ncbi:3-phosphoshikimate 1-carboxyvinyltransferase [Flammeovirgaceae bacterium SG7u.111]|nr:3-phosphoshikimate 1-carboxyvinyltransferase [Flammeovirgaceae bacterium SG7u.132]WPO35362.1 3-phosphoshikimate 1-carboxyvinyltransferase [Flammeovirgaceae bacterium SG7u.111]
MDNEKISITHPSKKILIELQIEGSKSECNRALIMQALSHGNIELSNLSNARDSQTMLRLLASDELTFDVRDAGTTMRFLTAYCAATGRETIMTGTERMQQRPIGILIDALREIGAEISYENKEGYPPIHIKSFKQKSSNVSIRGDVSSQYISALLMVAPTLESGLELSLVGDVNSRPYINMTLALMEHFGISYIWEGNVISIKPQLYTKNQYSIEPDWSGASYWYSLVALASEAKVKLLSLRENSLQGDKAIADIMVKLGVKSTFEKDGVVLEKVAFGNDFEWDFTHCPDLAQTVAVVCAAKGIKAKLTGLQSLRIKETDRIDALQREIKKIGVEVEVVGNEEIIIPGTDPVFKPIDFYTYDDHRMAMAFAPLGLFTEVSFDDATVVNKSYPGFWNDFKKAGFVKIES